MKEITDVIKKIPPDKIKELSARLELKRSTSSTIISQLLSIFGIDQILSELHTDELRILQLVYSGNDGITFGEIEKRLRIPIDEIEKYAESLAHNLLVYTIKNRQLLSNKMDKLYGIKELMEYINLVETEDIKKHLDKVNSALLEGKSNESLFQEIKGDDIYDLLYQIIQSGCVAPLEIIKKQLQKQSIKNKLPYLLQNGILIISHSITGELATYMAISDEIVYPVLKKMESNDEKPAITAENRYNSLINLLSTYDTISTFGLFLTKQGEFRKIDIKRLSQSMMAVLNIKGKHVNPETLVFFSLFIMNRLKCLVLNKDIAHISLHKIQKIIEQPQKLLQKIFRVMHVTEDVEPLFNPPMEIPSQAHLNDLINLIREKGTVSLKYIHITALTYLYYSSKKETIEQLISVTNDYLKKLDDALNLLCIMGVINVNGNNLVLSDLGEEFAAYQNKGDTVSESGDITKCIYINPDFTLMIPVSELPSQSLYFLLAHTEIVKNDVIINAVISKSSIVRAHKRGMSPKYFIETLTQHSRNELPQNLSFLIQEWSKQTIKLDLSNPILLRSSHPSFIDELLYGKTKEGILEKISDNYVIIKKEYIDEIVKIARKRDAVISLFTRFDDDN